MFAPTLIGSAPADGQDLYFVSLATPDTTPRAEARARIRQALHEALLHLLAADPESVALITTPGEPVRLAPPWADIGLSISHEPGLSLAVINLAGPVGVDLLRVATIASGSGTVARDYLGPDAASALAGLPDEQLQHAFAQAWTRLEARLKCLALELREWSPALEARLTGCRVTDLTMAEGWVGAVAIPGEGSSSAPTRVAAGQGSTAPEIPWGLRNASRSA